MKKIVFILFLIVTNGLNAQTPIWEEDFDSYSNGTTSGTATGFAASGWESGNGVSIGKEGIVTRSKNRGGFWRTDPINVFGFKDIELSFSVRSRNTHQHNRFSFRYRLDGGAWINIVEPMEKPIGSYTYSFPAGNSLELEALFNTQNGSNGRYLMDNILLTGTPPACPNVLDYEFYDLVPSGNTVDNIPTTGALSTGQINTFDVDRLQNNVDPGDSDRYSIRYSGYLHIPQSDTYTFYTSSDDGSKLFINGDEIVNNDGVHSIQESSGTATLSQGFHKLEVLFFENTGGQSLQVHASTSSIAKMALPFSHLYSDCQDPGEEPGNKPPAIKAIGDQIFCPGSRVPIVEAVKISDPDDTHLENVYIQISSNYDVGDLLSLEGSNPGITASWSVSEGKLTLAGPATISAFETAIQNVQFSTTATLDGAKKNFSIVIAEANYLQSTEHYYEYIPAIGITWTDARDAAALRKFYGLQGYLATITSDDEAQLLGTQATGAGWIGASDAAKEGEWRWVTGPEGLEDSGQGSLFWTGTSSGTAHDYENWNHGEPNNSGNEDYAHINAPGTGFDGSWNDLTNSGASSGAYQPKGYLVEYGGMPGDPLPPNVSAVTSLTPFVITPPNQPVDQTIFTGNPAQFDVSVNNADGYQWQVSTDGGATYHPISDGMDYSGTTTANLNVLRTDLDKSNTLYRIEAYNNESNCTVYSNGALLNVNVRTVITNKRITHRVNSN